MEHIDVVFYINLDHRVDRREHIEKELRLLCPDSSKPIRISAIKHSIGAIGCFKSHIHALELFLANTSWNTCMVLEDDFTFKYRTSEEINAQLNTFFRSIDTWDMLTLSYNPAAFNTAPTHDESIVKVLSTQTTSGYCVNRCFVETLLANFKAGCALKEQHAHSVDFCLDIFWKRLQPSANWYALVPAVGYQCEGYSDIEGKVVNYGC